MRDFASTLSIALVSVLAAVAVFGLLALLARPKRKRRKTVVRYYEDDEDEDIDDEDYDEDEMPRRMKNGAIVEKKAVYVQPHSSGSSVSSTRLASPRPPCILLVIFEVTPLKTGALKNVFDSAAVAKTWKYIHTYTLDFVMIGIVAAMGYGGYKTGVLRGFRSVFLI